MHLHEIQGHQRQDGQPASSASSSSGCLNATTQLAWEEAADANAKKIQEGSCLASPPFNLTGTYNVTRSFNFVVVMCWARLTALSLALPGPLRLGLREGLAWAFSRLGPGLRFRKPKAQGSSLGLVTNYGNYF